MLSLRKSRSWFTLEALRRGWADDFTPIFSWGGKLNPEWTRRTQRRTGADGAPAGASSIQASSYRPLPCLTGRLRSSGAVRQVSCVGRPGARYTSIRPAESLQYCSREYGGYRDGSGRALSTGGCQGSDHTRPNAAGAVEAQRAESSVAG